jgi:hypothetical protein
MMARQRSLRAKRLTKKYQTPFKSPPNHPQKLVPSHAKRKNMSLPAGFIFHFNEPERAKQILNAIRSGKGIFSEALSVADWNPKAGQLALLSFSGETLDYLGIAERGNRVVTGKYRVEFRELLPLSNHPISEFEALLGQSVRQHFMRSASGVGGRIPEKTWLQCLEVLKALEPAKQREIERMINLANLAGTFYSGHERELLMVQRDAFGSALDIFSGSNKLRKEVLSAWAPNQDEKLRLDSKEPTPNFLDNISTRFLQEESALQHDLFNWPDSFTVHRSGRSKFIQGDRTLDVVYANRNPLERTLGVDLIYYNVYYQLFALVQYKLMTSSGTEATPKFGYRPDKQFDQELIRMNDFANHFASQAQCKSERDFRWNNDGFFFKLVPNQSFMIGSDELSPGMYIPREYMNVLLDSENVRGPRNGIQIDPDNVERHLSNTDFVNAINKGWLGTNGTTSEMLEKIVKHYLETGKALIIATEQRI